MPVAAFTNAHGLNEKPDEFQVYTFGPYQAAGLADATYPLMVFDREVNIEQITLRATAPAAASSDTLQFKVAASGTAPASGTNISAADPLDALTANTAFKVPLAQSGNPHLSIAGGSCLAMTTAGTIASLANLQITVRVSNRRSIENDAGGKRYLEAPLD